jgi:UDP-2,4-diacetamido-2,4,6-trideoxy-beta-L-altropyranose hydrolase
MRIAIRADASIALGSGHVMRCLALADALRERGAKVAFLSRELPGHLCALVEHRGFDVMRLPARDTPPAWERDVADSAAALQSRDGAVDWLVADHYLLDARWEGAMRRMAKQVMVLDDMANRPHDANLLLDQNLADDMEDRYRAHVAPSCRQLLGPRWALLRREFSQARAAMRMRDGRLQRILLFFGGSDPTDETSKALRGVAVLAQAGIRIDVVVGSSNPRRDEVARLAAGIPNIFYYCQTEDMAALMVQADLAIGAGGSVSWERCCLGLPALAVILAENQRPQTEALARYGAQINLGWADRLRAEEYRRAVTALRPGALLEMERRGMELVDGGGAGRVAELMIS